MTEATGIAPPGPILYAALNAEGYEAAIPELADLLVDAIDSGAGVQFMAGLGPVTAATWWRERVPLVREGTILPLIARAPERIVGVTLLILARTQNGPHRADISKVLVLRPYRGRGIATRLMGLAEEVARGEGRWLLVLDTNSGSPADALYRSLGWNVAGSIPNFSFLPDGVLSPTTIFWKDLRDDPGASGGGPP